MSSKTPRRRTYNAQKHPTHVNRPRTASKCSSKTLRSCASPLVPPKGISRALRQSTVEADVHGDESIPEDGVCPGRRAAEKGYKQILVLFQSSCLGQNPTASINAQVWVRPSPMIPHRTSSISNSAPIPTTSSASFFAESSTTTRTNLRRRTRSFAPLKNDSLTSNASIFTWR